MCTTTQNGENCFFQHADNIAYYCEECLIQYKENKLVLECPELEEEEIEEGPCHNCKETTDKKLVLGSNRYWYCDTCLDKIFE